jgi:tetratricopeptide (TPR) repeat protein
VAELREHGRQTFAAVLFGLHRAERTGVLEIRQGRRWRKVWFARGRPVLYGSNLDSEGLGKTLVQAGLVGARPMARVLKKLLPDENLEDELVSLGLVEPEELAEHKRQTLERGSVSALAWPNGEWSFLPSDGVGPWIDPSLLPDVNPLRALWTEVRQRVHMEEAVGFVTEAGAGELAASETLTAAMASLEVEEPLSRLPEILEDGPLEVDELFRRLQDRSGHLVHLVWLLETVGELRRANRTLDEHLARLGEGRDFGEAEVTPEPEPKPAIREPGLREVPLPQPDPDLEPLPPIERKPQERKSSPPPRSVPGRAVGSRSQISRRALAHLPELLRTARKHRMRKNFYAFLDLTQEAKTGELESAYKRLVGLWRNAAETPALAEGARKDAHDLMQAALTVWRTLSDPDRRAEYDKRLGQGRAPSLESLVSTGVTERALSTPGAPPPSAPRSARRQVSKADRARRLVDRGEFAQALPLLQQLRLENPSDAEVISDLGWTTWRLKGNDESAEEYLRLALTFDSSNVRALEFMARISKEQGNEDEARKHVERLLSVDPNSKWGLAAMKSFGPGGDGAKSGRRFWKRGG